jgi:hypothetical protein
MDFYGFFVDKVGNFLSKFSTLMTSQKIVFFALSDASRCVFEKNILQILLSNLNQHMFSKIFKKSLFFN